MFPYNFSPKTISFLDRVRYEQGIDGLRSYFRNLVNYNIENAATLINDENLQFCTLYALQPEVTAQEISSRLGFRNQKALEITNGISAREETDTRHLIDGHTLEAYPVLRWILASGCSDDGLNNRYDEVLDFAALLLTKYYKDRSILYTIVDMIFKRHKKGLFIYHLVWAFFESRVPYSLILIASRLCSYESKDVELACKLLCFIPCAKMSGSTDQAGLYYQVLQWIQENHLFLHYTGESFHHTNRPVPYIISMESKYLCKPVSADSRDASGHFTEDERKLVNRFMESDPDTRALLSDFSYLLYRRDYYRWNTWLHYPVSEQIRIAKSMTGGLA